MKTFLSNDAVLMRINFQPIFLNSFRPMRDLGHPMSTIINCVFLSYVTNVSSVTNTSSYFCSRIYTSVSGLFFLPGVASLFPSLKETYFWSFGSLQIYSSQQIIHDLYLEIRQICLQTSPWRTSCHLAYYPKTCCFILYFCSSCCFYFFADFAKVWWIKLCCYHQSSQCPCRSFRLLSLWLHKKILVLIENRPWQEHPCNGSHPLQLISSIYKLWVNHLDQSFC